MLFAVAQCRAMVRRPIRTLANASGRQRFWTPALLDCGPLEDGSVPVRLFGRICLGGRYWAQLSGGWRIACSLSITVQLGSIWLCKEKLTPIAGTSVQNCVAVPNHLAPMSAEYTLGDAVDGYVGRERSHAAPCALPCAGVGCGCALRQSEPVL